MVAKFLNSVKNDHFLKGTFFLTVMNFVGSFLNYLVHPIIARSLSVSEYGSYQAILSFLNIFSILTIVVMTSVMKETARLKAQQKTEKVLSFQKAINKKLFFLGSGIIFFIIIASPLIDKFLKIGNKISIIVASLFFLYIFTLAINRGILNGLQKFYQLSISTFLEPLARFLAVFIFVSFLGWQLFGAAMSIALTGIIAFIYSFKQLKDIKLSQNKKEDYNFKFLFNYSFVVLFFLVANQFFNNLDILFVKVSLSPEEAGLYSALMTVGKIIFFIGAVIPMVMFPIVAEQCSEKSFRKYHTLLKSIIFTLIIISPFVIFIIMFPELMIKLLVGDKFLPVAVFLPFFALPVVLLVFINLLLKYFLALEYKKVGIILISGVLLEFIILFFNRGTIQDVIYSITISFLIINIALVVYLYFNFKKDKKIIYS